MKFHWDNFLLVTLGCFLIMGVEYLVFDTPQTWTLIFYVLWGVASAFFVGPILSLKSKE